MTHLPESKNIERIDSESYHITCAAWIDSYGYTSYEIGIRDKEQSNLFWLIQSDKFHGNSSVIEHGKIIKEILNCKNLGLDAVMKVY